MPLTPDQKRRLDALYAEALNVLGWTVTPSGSLTLNRNQGKVESVKADLHAR